MAKILIVEDDHAMAIALRDGFSYEGFQVDVAGDGEEGLRLARESDADLMILDVMLPKMTGLEVCRSLRGDGSGLPIIMLTARGQEIDKVLGLKLGADDYVTKPFSFMELRARVEAVLRRSAQTPKSRNGGTHFFGQLMVDLDHHIAEKDGVGLELTPREFRLLDHFIHHRGEVVTREQLLDDVWGYDTIPFTRTVDTHIAKLRKKIEDNPADPRLIVTVHRLGYKFVG
ncbi:MAG: response regulator transcription factor [Thermoanaerobaculales bacterium]|jgi:DNA-binding response OmpR family regulator|nr:response regulator transcription factor [Thermoanaerobaculales bacterium]